MSDCIQSRNNMRFWGGQMF